MMKVVRTNVKMTGSTTVDMPCSRMLKKTRKKPHQYTKANSCCHNCRRVQKTKMNMTKKTVSRTSTVTAEVTIITMPAEGPRSG